MASSKLGELTTQAEQMLDDLAKAEDEVEELTRNLRDLEEEYAENVSGTTRSELIEVADGLAELSSDGPRLSSGLSESRGALTAWLQAHGVRAASVGRSASSTHVTSGGGGRSPKARREVPDEFFLDAMKRWLPASDRPYEHEWHMESYKDAEPFHLDESGNERPRNTDVRQGNLGDCWLLAVFMAVASRQKEALTKRLESLGDDRFSVRLGCENAALSEAIDFEMSGGAPTRRTLEYFFAPPNNLGIGPRWPMLFEKAFAALHGGHPALQGGSPDSGARALTLLLCEETQIWGPARATTPKDLSTALDSAIANGPATVHINRLWRQDVGLPVLSDHAFHELRKKSRTAKWKFNLFDSHVYQLIGRDKEGFYLLGNPHNGGEPPLRLTAEELTGIIRAVVGLK